MALQQGWFLSKSHPALVIETIQNTILGVSQTIIENGWSDPTKDDDPYSLASFYNYDSKSSKMKSQKKYNNKPYLHASSQN